VSFGAVRRTVLSILHYNTVGVKRRVCVIVLYEGGIVISAPSDIQQRMLRVHVPLQRGAAPCPPDAGIGQRQLQPPYTHRTRNASTGLASPARRSPAGGKTHIGAACCESSPCGARTWLLGNTSAKRSKPAATVRELCSTEERKGRQWRSLHGAEAWGAGNCATRERRHTQGQ